MDIDPGKIWSHKSLRKDFISKLALTNTWRQGQIQQRGSGCSLPPAKQTVRNSTLLSIFHLRLLANVRKGFLVKYFRLFAPLWMTGWYWPCREACLECSTFVHIATQLNRTLCHFTCRVTKWYRICVYLIRKLEFVHLWPWKSPYARHIAVHIIFIPYWQK